MDSRPDSAPAETSPGENTPDEEPDSPTRGQQIGRLETLKESEEMGQSASQGPSRALSGSESSAKQKLEASRPSDPPSGSGLPGKPDESGDLSSAAELAKSKSRGKDSAHSHYKLLSLGNEFLFMSEQSSKYHESLESKTSVERLVPFKVPTPVTCYLSFMCALI